MSDYTPSTEEVREEFIYGHQEVDMDGYVVVSFHEASARWERWLAAVKAEAWDEGHSWGWSDALEAHDVRQEMPRDEWRLRTPNPHQINELTPYRKEAAHDA